MSLYIDIVAVKAQPKCSAVIWREEEQIQKLLLTAHNEGTVVL